MKSRAALLLLAIAASPLLAADFVVTNTNTADVGSLYQAITDANNTPGADRIVFNIPGPGIHTIDISNQSLPIVTESLEIDGYSQPGAKANSLERGDDAVILVQLDGQLDGFRPPASNGLVFYSVNKPSNYAVRGLCLTAFTSAAITAGRVDSLVVAGNFIGVLPDGETARGNGAGIGHATQIGGTDPASRNIISGNATGFAGEASPAPGSTIYGAIVQGNYFGTNASGTKAVPNGIAVGLEKDTLLTGNRDSDLSNTIIGGTAPGAGNLIGGNTSAIVLGGVQSGSRGPTYRDSVNNLQIQGNTIGLQADRATPLPNGSGITIVSGSRNLIGNEEFGNIIAHSGVGVSVTDGTGNAILSNAIYGNRIGIDLGYDGPTANDGGDADTGPNNYQNHPVIESAQLANGSVTITGTLNSTPNSEFMVQYFSESLTRPQTYLGSDKLMTDANGNAAFSHTFPLSDTNVLFNVTATGADGTSEFAQNSARLRNISTRVLVKQGEQAAIAGFIVSRSFLSDEVVLRALGPSLRGIFAPLLDPSLELHDATGALIARNDNWRDDPNHQYVESAGLAPINDAEPAIAMGLDDGSYTAVVSGVNGMTGIALVEAYYTTFGYGEPLNISTRGFVGTGDDVMIAGTILEQVPSSTRIVVRALGPSLAAAGVTNPLADPTLELHDGEGNIVTANDNWGDGEAAALKDVGLAPPNDNESAIFIRLMPGAYTAIVRGKDNSIGVGLVEIYNLH